MAFSSQLGFLARLQFQAIFEAAVHCPLSPLRIWPLPSIILAMVRALLGPRFQLFQKEMSTFAVIR
jgi:hypothetical protein